MTLVTSEFLLSALIEIQEKITLLEHELHIQSIFVAVDVNGISYTHASSKGKEFLQENNDATNLFMQHCGADVFLCSERRLGGKLVDADVSELGSFMALLEECDVNESNLVADNDPLGLDLEATSEEISNEMLADDVLVGNVEFRCLDEQETPRVMRPDDAGFILLEDPSKDSDVIDAQNVPDEGELPADRRPRRCHRCDSSFESEDELHRHEKMHLCRRLFHCTRCSTNFDSVGSVKQHDCEEMTTCTATKSKGVAAGKETTDKFPFCRWCGETFETDSERQTHVSEHLKSGFKCHRCEARFKTWRTLRDHLSSVHADALPFRCKSCNAAFKTALLMCRHERNAHGISDGNDLGIDSSRGNRGRIAQKFTSKNKLSGIDGRIPNDLFLCPSCGRCFDFEKELECHVSRVHKENKGAACSVRGRKLRSRIQLDRHTSVLHPGTSVKAETLDRDGGSQLICANCKQEFKNVEDLQVHLHVGGCFGAKTELLENSVGVGCKAENLVGRGPQFDSTVYSDKTGDACDGEVADKTLQKIPAETKKPAWQQKRRQTGSCNLCHICGKNFALPHYLRQHLVGHRERRPFECQHCDKRFKRRSILQEHSAMHSGSKGFSCKVCAREFHFASVLRQHMAVHSSKRSHVCDICHKSFKYSVGLKKHRCPGMLEPNVSSQPPSLLFDQPQLHKDRSMPPVELSPGDKIKRILRESDPSRPFACQLCSKRFCVQKALKKHSRVHSDERPFACQLCNKRFKHSSSLLQHRSVHSNERPYECSCCSKRFKNSTGLREHLDKNKYKCTGCGKQYMHKKSLISHLTSCFGSSKNTEESRARQLDVVPGSRKVSDEVARVGKEAKMASKEGSETTADDLPTSVRPDANKSATFVYQQKQPQFTAIAFPSRIIFQAELIKPQQLCLLQNGGTSKATAGQSLASNFPQADSSYQQWLAAHAQLSYLQMQQQQERQLQQQFI